MLKLIPVLVALAAASPALAADPAPVLKADREFAAMSAKQGMKAAFIAYAAPEITFANVGTIIAGPSAAQLADFPTDNAAFALDWTVVGGAMSDDGTLGATWGTFRRTLHGKLASEGAYTTVWRKTADGRWQFVQDGGSDKAPPPR